MIFAIDYDDTLFTNAYPAIGEPKYKMISKVKKLREQGHKIILWTCRSGKELEEAVESCREYGLEFDAVNENVNPSPRFNPRKVFAHYYVDDRNALIEDFIKGDF